MPYSVELSMFDYSKIFLPVQALNNEVVRRALDIKSFKFRKLAKYNVTT